MSTSPTTLAHFLDILSFVPELRSRAMFGEYGIYSGDRMFALACDNTLFFKTTPSSLHLFSDTESKAYPGSKNTAPANPEWFEDDILLRSVVGEILDSIPERRQMKKSHHNY